MNITKPFFDQRERELLDECLASGWVTQGPFCARMEQLLAQRHALAHARVTTSCTAALHLAALALGLGPGDEVIVPSFTWITSANCAEYVGAKPVFCDVNADTFNICPQAFEAAITPRTKAVVAVHLFGRAAPMNEILAIANKHGVAVIEDAACAIGTTYAGKPVGGLGDVGCFSFHPRKVITTGEGGAVTTNSDELAQRVATFRNHGVTGMPVDDPTGSQPFTMACFAELGFNLRLSDIQAAVGVAQFEKLDELLAERRTLAAGYSELLANLEAFVLPVSGPQEEFAGHTYQSYVIRVRDGERSKRNAIMGKLAEHGMQSRPGTHAVHLQEYYQSRYDIDADAFPVSKAMADTTITLPLFPGMTQSDQEQVAQVLKDSVAAL